MQLGKYKEALDFALAAKCLAPSSAEVAEKVDSIRKQLSAGFCLEACFLFYLSFLLGCLM